MIKHIIVLLLVISTLEGCAQKTEDQIIPCIEEGMDLAPLRTLDNTTFQLALETVIAQKPMWKKLVDEKRLSIGLVDLKDQNDIRFATLNGDDMMYAASLPKIAILLAAMDAFEKKEVKETKAIQKDLRLMIAKSNNQASTRMIDLLGYDKIESVMTDPKYKFYDEMYGGGLWVGKRYAAGGAKNPDPMKGLSHAATTTQICRFYYMMYQGKLVNEKRSKEMMKYMVDPELSHKFINSLKKVAPKAKYYRKSGSWQNFHSDSVMVWGPKRQYILSALVDHPNGEMIMRELVYEVEKVIKNRQYASRL